MTRLAAALLALLASLLLVSSASAADVRVIRSSFESRFPQGMAFTMDAAVVGRVQKVTLSYRVAGRRAIVAGDARFEQQGGALRAVHDVDLTRRYLPPGTEIQFEWHVVDDRGQRTRTEAFQAVVEDKRFQWKQLRSPNFELNWYQGDENFGRILIGIAGRALNTLGSEAGVTIDRPVRAFVYGDLEEFRAASFLGGLEWVGGTYYPRQNVILIYAPPNQQGLAIAQRALPHELAHAVVHQVSDNPYGDVPQWLNEGLATRSEPGMNPDQSAALAKAVAEGKLMSLRSIGGSFPTDPDEALLAYAQSYSVVTYLVEEHGRMKLNALLRTYREGVTHDEGLKRALGMDTAQLDQEWRAWMAPWAPMKATPFAELPEGPPAGDEGRTQGNAADDLVAWLRGLAEEVWGQR